MSYVFGNMTKTQLYNKLKYKKELIDEGNINMEILNIYDDEKYGGITSKLSVSILNYITMFSRYLYFRPDPVNIVEEFDIYLCIRNEYFELKKKYNFGKLYNIDDEFNLCICEQEYTEKERENLYNTTEDKNRYYFDNICMKNRPMHYLTSGLLCIGKNLKENTYDYYVINSTIYMGNIIQINYNTRTFKFTHDTFEKYALAQLDNIFNINSCPVAIEPET